MFWQMMELPENKQLAKLLGEMFSEEIVFYAGEDFIKFIELMQVINGSRIAPLAEAIEAGGGSPPSSDPAAQFRMIVDEIVADPRWSTCRRWCSPFASRTATRRKFNSRGSSHSPTMFDQTGSEPRSSAASSATRNSSCCALKGSMIPLPGSLPPGIGIDEESYANLKEVIADKELFVTLGTRHDYVLLSLGKSVDHLGELGARRRHGRTPGARVARRPQRPQAGRRLLRQPRGDGLANHRRRGSRGDCRFGRARRSTRRRKFRWRSPSASTTTSTSSSTT